MLEKAPSLRPCALEVRQLARAIAMELASRYAELELDEPNAGDGLPDAGPRRRLPPLPRTIPTDEAVVVDPDALECGITELVPIVHKPRWTPEIVQAFPSAMAAPPHDRIGPRSAHDQVPDEVVLLEKRRS